MNIRLEVVRFRSEDIIATSGHCQNYGLHFYADEVTLTPENDFSTIITYHGDMYNYTSDGELEWATDSRGEYRYDANSVSLGYILLEPGKWYNLNENDHRPWTGTLCVPQTH